MQEGTFEVRTAGEPTAIISAMREAIKEVDPNLPISLIRTQVEQADETLRMERLFAKLLTSFGLLAQQLAAIGLFGVLAYTVSQRTHEIGIRMALGARVADVLRLVFQQGLVLTMIGVGIGIALAFALTRLMKSLLFDVTPTDAMTFVMVAVTLVVVALLACLVPARRATKVDPLIALRYE
jgi:ABC-type antimicrobial peptide transport system permease subunit